MMSTPNIGRIDMATACAIDPIGWSSQRHAMASGNSRSVLTLPSARSRETAKLNAEMPKMARRTTRRTGMKAAARPSAMTWTRYQAMVPASTDSIVIGATAIPNGGAYM